MEFKTNALYKSDTVLAEEDAIVYGGNVTVLDLKCAARLYPILIKLAKQKQTVTYGQLCQLAHDAYPDWEHIRSIIPVRCGRLLGVIGQFQQENNLPFLQALVLNQTKKDCGSGIKEVMDTKLARQEVFEFDWESVTDSFHHYITLTEKRVTRPKKAAPPLMSSDEAHKLMFGYYKAHKTSLPRQISEHRDALVTLIQYGKTAEEAFAIIVDQHI
ncbi:hypothetical protein [Photobacterium lipolyticum]|uniref:Uncharacterized protein n=1 Tax=Photobacterium lipolyticum TaxID=266810 RepID=A0A2T3MWP5_9GAMM|nr:hypothetical protein [Photobacterium lipolyticum]PSW04390.1 hypothetical protein C9I89_13785 [Photobacterium lipolyticum]